LVFVSGGLSYAGIQALSKQLGVPVVAAKPIVEMLLFSVNFAVQRLFIFHRRESGTA
jgi:hypothetical protein